MSSGSVPPARVTEDAAPAEPSAAAPERIGGRYRVLGELGRGGMACVYRVHDDASGRELALKQLLRRSDEKRASQSAALFEREFRTLVELSHPLVIEVYDYGVAPEGPYYTMELLGGGDLRERSPLPWREACELLIDVCSSLALLHSRRLVHRDVSPRNIRCTHDGHAKLIDFGAMAAMGLGGAVVGTPAFVAPEVVHRSALDARTDLYSLGATLYYALTGRMPYPARDLASVLKAWSSPAAPPSLFATEVPAELDALVLSMISLEPALRPRSAFEVIQRLRALGGMQRPEPAGVSLAYLATPNLVGREQALTEFGARLARARRAEGGAVLVQAEAGLGRSRLLDAFALEAKLLGAVILRVGCAGAGDAPLAAARELAGQVLEALPEVALAAARDSGVAETILAAREPVASDSGIVPALRGGALSVPAVSVPPSPLRLRELPTAPAERLGYQSALARWLLRVARVEPLLVAIDDVDRADEPSLGLFAQVAHRARRSKLLLVATADAASKASAALDVLAEYCVRMPLRPLTREETEALLTSVFGDVPNIGLLSERIHAVAAGRPRECMALAQHLVERGAIAYADGAWTLPEALAEGELPTHAEDVLRARIAALDPRALRLARLHALSILPALERADYALLDPDAPAGAVDAALSALLAHDVLRGDDRSYTLSHRVVCAALQDGIAKAERAQHHRALAELYERSGRPPLATAAHWLDAGEPARALDRASETLGRTIDRVELMSSTLLSNDEIGAVLERLLDAAEALPESPRRLTELRRWLLSLSVATEDRFHRRAGPLLLAQLERDSGLLLVREQDDPDPMQRLLRGLARAQDQYNATPEAERVYRVDEAIKHLVGYVVISIAVGARTFDARLIRTLPGLLEPFAPLSPVLHAIWQNALATFEINQRKLEQARTRWLEVYARLEDVSGAELEHVAAIRSAVAYAIGSTEALLGMQSVGKWAALLDQDPMQQVNAMYLRKTVCLQRGDFETAERFRRKAELLSIQATTRQMFTTTVVTELVIHATARDLVGVKQLMDRILPVAAEHEGWRPYRYLAVGFFERLRGDLEAARVAFAQALALAEPDPDDPGRAIVAWPSAAAGYIDTLVEIGSAAQAREIGERTLERCTALEIGIGAFDVERALALAEAKLGDFARAAARLERMIAVQRGLGVVGLTLGTTYEARARVAIWAGDAAAVEGYGRLAAGEFRHGHDSPLGTRYERLLQEARRAGIHGLPQLASLDTSPIGTTTLGGARATETLVTEALKGADGRSQRAELALGLLCEAHAAGGGHLYVLGEKGLDLVATRAASEPDAQLQQFLDGFWRQQLIEPDMATAHVPEGGEPAPVSTGSLCTDSRGIAYHPVVISGVQDGETVYVGVALLVPGHSSARVNAADITRTVGTYLVRSGDASGVAA